MRLRHLSSIARTVLLAWVAASCSTWSARPVEGAGGAPLPRQVRVTLADGRQVLLDDPVATADSLKGIQYRGRYRAFANADVASVESQETDWNRTTLLGGVLLVAVLFIGKVARSTYCDVACLVY